MISLKFLYNKIVLFFCVTFVKASDLQVIPLEEWNTETTLKKENMPSIPVHVMMHQTTTEPCFSRSQCENILKKSINFSDFSDVSNFYVGGDGKIYAAHGWDSMGESDICSYDLNKPMIVISFIGNFDKSKLSTKQLKATQQLLEQGVLTGKLNKSYVLLGSTDFPTNDDNKELLESFPHWSTQSSRCIYLD